MVSMMREETLTSRRCELMALARIHGWQACTPYEQESCKWCTDRLIAEHVG